jgi:hypothetical protein
VGADVHDALFAGAAEDAVIEGAGEEAGEDGDDVEGQGGSFRGRCRGFGEGMIDRLSAGSCVQIEEAGGQSHFDTLADGGERDEE